MTIENLSTRTAITAFLIFSLVPLILMPPSSFSPISQEWWLPVLLMFLAVVAIVQLVVRRTEKSWPWDLLIFSHGFNIISRLMLLMPHATVNAGGVQVLNTGYVALSLFSMAFSAFLLWYMGVPSVRIGLMKD